MPNHFPQMARSAVLIVCAAIVIGMNAAIASLQTPQAPKATPAPAGLIVGRVIDGATNAPIAGVTVILSGSNVRTNRVIVDPQGRFVFSGLPAGAFTIYATKPGYVPSNYGTLRPDASAGRALELGTNERVTNAVIRMWRFATISGHVIDDAGDPVPYAQVQPFGRKIVAGHWQLESMNNQGTTDERGAYRISGLWPGDYALVITSVVATLPPSLLSLADALKRAPGPDSSLAMRELNDNGTGGYASDFTQGFPVTRFGDLLMQTGGKAVLSADGKFIESYPTVWYPNAATPAEASLITLRSGENRTGIDLHPTLVRTPKVSGTVIGPGGPVPHLALRLVPARLGLTAAEITSSVSLSLMTATAATDVNGAFTFLAVPPGQYIIRSLTTPAFTSPPSFPGVSSLLAIAPTDPVWWSATPVSVGAADTTGVTVTLRPGLRVSGRVEFSGGLSKPSPQELLAIRVYLEPADGRTIASLNAYRAQITADGNFYTVGLTSGSYVLKLENPPKGWTLKSAMAGGRDICDAPVELTDDDVNGLVITFTDRPSNISGTVRNDQGRPDDDAIVLVFPADGPWIDLGTRPRRVQSIRASRTGGFSVTGLPAGAYFVIAISDTVARNWQDPAFLQTVARVARRITVDDGQSLSLTLTTTAGITR